MLFLPRIPDDNSIIEYQTMIPYTAISVPARTYRSLIVGIPGNYVVSGTSIRGVTQFAGPSLSSLTCSLGAFIPNSILTDILYYGLECELTQVPTPLGYVLSGPPNNNLNLETSQSFSPATALYFNGPHDIGAYFTAQGTNLNTLTAGVVEITVQLRYC